MNKIDKINFKEIKRISPSQFYSMKNCAYKSLLAEAFDKKPLLPISPNAYYGTVLHKMLELITKGNVTNENEYNNIFDDQIKEVEYNLIQNGYTFFIPLRNNVKDFGFKKFLLKKHLISIVKQSEKQDNFNFFSEKWYESKDKLIAGRIDLVIEDTNGSEIIDFKTGAITEDVLDDSGETFSEIKEEYKDQLKLYAYLYFENTGKFPTHLSLVDLAKQKFPVEFSQSECKTIFEDAKILLRTTNESIDNGNYTPKPTETNCKYCLYRPACSLFGKLLDSGSAFNDVSGIVRNIVKYKNGNVSVFLENGVRNITVTNFSSEKYNELKISFNKKISIYNLHKEKTENIYSAIKTTRIYE